MITPEDQAEIKQATLEFWQDRITDKAFDAMARGKEGGHHIADYVDQQTSEMIVSRFNAGYEMKHGRVVKRSMGDVWINSKGMWNPVNIKAGIEKNGQPNIVSLQKLLGRITGHEIDSYYLLIVKFDISAAEKLEPSVYFIDILDYLDYVTFDAGPGQMMLKERDFYAIADNGLDREPHTLTQKTRELHELLQDGYRRLLDNRAKRMAKTRQQVDKFLDESEYVSQGGIQIG